ncbi:MAG: RRXRR domain-containing protein [Thermodesulfobacteriota bacterium]
MSTTPRLKTEGLVLLEGQVERNKERRMYRIQRRSRLRHRKARFNNRRKIDGWLPPSIQHKLDSHIKTIERLPSSWWNRTPTWR